MKEQSKISNLKYLGNAIFHEEKDVNVKLRMYNKMNGMIKLHFWNSTRNTKLSITQKTALCGSETWTTNKTGSPKMEAT